MVAEALMQPWHSMNSCVSSGMTSWVAACTTGPMTSKAAMSADMNSLTFTVSSFSPAFCSAPFMIHKVRTVTASAYEV